MRLSKRLLPVLVLTFLSFIIAPKFAQAANSINFDVEDPSGTVFNQSLQISAISPCTTPDNATSTINGFCAFAAAGLSNVSATSTLSGLQVTSVNGISGNWQWFLNGSFQSGSIENYTPQAGDSILWTEGIEPLQVTLSTTTPAINATTTVTVMGFATSTSDFVPVAGATIVGASATTNANGIAAIVATSTIPLTISVTAPGFIPSQQFTITPQSESIMLTVRDGSATAFSGSVNLPEQSAPDIMVTPTNSTSSVAVSQLSVLGVLEAIEASSTAFNITSLSYSTTTDSFTINCIAVPSATSTPDCSNWTYAVNGNYPQTGINRQILNNGDAAYLFFGTPHQTVLSQSSIAVGQSFTATAEQYNLSSGDYQPLTGVILGVVTFNPNSSYTELATSTVDTNGNAMFTLNTAGTFAVGIKEDSYSPSAALAVTSAPPSGGGLSHTTFNIPNALTFISSQQNTDGSFGSLSNTDWAAIALASVNSGAAKTKLTNYLLSSTPTVSDILDDEQQALALEALDINPYSATSVNYITAITNGFNGTQIGSSGDTDDIFALLPLEHAGFTSGDLIIQKEAAFVVSTQQPDGSWDESPATTAAAIQALGPLFDISGVNNALGQAAGYLASTELPNGGWGNTDSTSWVQTAINGIIQAQTPGFETETPWTSTAGYLPTDAIANAQQSSGGVQSANSLLSTSYAITAASGQSWVSILNSFPQPSSSGSGGSVGAGGSSSSGEVLGTATSTPNILTAPAATSIPATATSTKTITILLPTLIINRTTSTVTTLGPKAESHKKPGVKTKKYSHTALKQAKPEAVHPTMSQTQATTMPPPENRGFLERTWHAISFFFHHLF